ncbi:BspA family leucine-rich repeat surface protein [Allomuricauda sp. ARW1Y1]|jgi:surface protein|uniref:BspA family leucine-rich repeat surface protein n=1 Tax=Allomuricauda sp. ARW1Y1 TaxID=2663843 RepID=UPI0015CA10D5|nr:BspA family leucine-rich repeat surface protein [Muricauda sp. ARW1Y1]NYJ27148.1 surface protein [Muricauda sp. ARW1Y1]
MKTRYLLPGLCALALLWSCDPNESDSELVNHAPVVPDQNFTVPEALPAGSPIGALKATDKDGDALVFSLTDDQSGFFSVTKGGTLSLSEGQSLDYTKYPEQQLKIYVHDGTVGRPGNITITVVRTDPENLPPTMEAQTFEANEDIGDTDIIGTVTATDPEEDALAFAIVEDVDGLFELTEAGELSLAAGKSLDFETKQEHVITVTANDGNGFVQAEITVQVLDVDEPTMEAQTFEANEDIGDTDIIGTVKADYPGGDNITFAIEEDVDGLFELTEAGELSLAEGKSLDFETQEEHTITVSASDGNVPVQAIITIQVLNVNEAPTAADQGFEANEDIADTEVIGTLTANDPEGDEITFTLAENLDGLFELTEAGELSLAEGANLDFETQEEHTITISASDGTNEPVTFTVTITVNNVMDSLFEDPASFILKFQVVDGQVLGIGTNPNYDYDFTIDWGDDTGEQQVNQQNPTHLYANGGTYSVAIKGTFPALSMGFTNSASRNALVDVSQWGTNVWQSMEFTFFGCQNLVDFTAMERPDLSQVENMSSMFYGASSFNGSIGDWETINVTSMAQMFQGASSFNQDIGEWKTENVTSMVNMFWEASSFNQDIGLWNTKNVTNMARMFQEASSFDQNLGVWDISSIAFMSDMFDNSGMSHTNANATLAGWANFVQVNEGPFDIALGMENVPLCGESGDYALNVLINDYNWQIPQTFDYNPECP